MNLAERLLTVGPVAVFLPVCEIVDTIVALMPVSGSISRERKKLLIVRLDAIGDFILFLDEFKAYRRLFPHGKWEITLLGNNAWSSLASNLSYADRYVFIDKHKFLYNPAYRFRQLAAIRKEGYDLLVEPTYARTYLFGDAVVRASAAPARIGSVGSAENMISFHKRRADRWYTRLIPASVSLLQELERNAEFLRGLGLKDFTASAPVYPLEALSGPFGDGIVALSKPYFVIAPGSGRKGRQWPAERFAEVGRWLHHKCGWIPVLCGSADELSLSERVISCAPELPWVDLTGKTSLGQLMRLLAKSRMLVANETGTVHIAAAVGCPTVCITGGGHFGRFFPYGDPAKNRVAFKKMDCFGCNWWCKYPSVRCIREISLQDVVREIEVLLGAMRDVCPT